MTTSDKAAGGVAVRVEATVVPPEVLDLLRFMCQTWAAVDAWAYATCESDQLFTYPVVQGTRNQIRLKQIGDQPYDRAALARAVDWMHNAGHNSRGAAASS